MSGPITLYNPSSPLSNPSTPISSAHSSPLSTPEKSSPLKLTAANSRHHRSPSNPRSRSSEDLSSTLTLSHLFEFDQAKADSFAKQLVTEKQRCTSEVCDTSYFIFPLSLSFHCTDLIYFFIIYFCFLF